MVTIAYSGNLSLIHCGSKADFWEIMHIICTAKHQEALRELAINALVDDAIKNIPGIGTTVSGGIQLQNSVDVAEEPTGREDGPEEFESVRDADEETAVGEA